MPEQTVILIMRAYPKPENCISLKQAKCAMPSTNSYRIDWPLFAYALEIETMSLRIDLP
jgi:hypothetical protein